MIVGVETMDNSGRLMEGGPTTFCVQTNDAVLLGSRSRSTWQLLTKISVIIGEGVDGTARVLQGASIAI